MTPQRPVIFRGVPLLLVVLAVKTLVALRGVSFHLVQLLKIWLVLNLLQDLVNQLSEHSTDKMPHKVSPRLVVIISIQLEVPFILRDHFSFLLSLLLVLLDLIILINIVHELTHTLNRFPDQRLSQIMLGGQVDLESPYSHVIEVPIYLVKHLPIPVRIRFQGLPLLHGHRQQGI